MKLVEVKKLLDDNGYRYTQTVIPSRAEFYREKGFHPSADTGAFTLLTFPNPNHEKDIQIIFSDATENPEFYDLEFGSFWYELFDCEEEYLRQELLAVSKIKSPKSWWNKLTGKTDVYEIFNWTNYERITK